MFAVRVWCLVLLCATALHAQPLDVRDKRDAASGVVTFPETPVADTAEGEDGPILSEASADTELERDQRSADDEYEYVDDDSEDGPEGRHLHKIKRKIKRKLKPHKYGGLFGGFGGYPSFGGHGGGHQHHHHHHGGGGYDCRKLHGCGGFGGWQQPSYGGGPIATAIAGPSHGGGGWNPSFGGFGGYGNRPNAQASSWNFGPLSIGWANANGK